MKAIFGIRGWFLTIFLCGMSQCLGQAGQTLLQVDPNKPEPAGARSRIFHRSALASVASERETKEFIYKKTPQGDLKIHVHFPASWKSSDQRPAMVFFFGGGWKQGSVTQFARQAEYFASRGMVAARADYRVSSRHDTTPDKCVEDARSAIRWLRSRSRELGIDGNRLVGSGGSAGGHVAACAALLKGPDDPRDDLGISCRPDVLVLFNPVVDLAGVGGAVLDGSGHDLKETLSPIRGLASGAPPAILFYGTQDRFLDAGLAFVRRAKELGIRAEGHTAADQPHGFFNRTPWQEITMRQADEFLASLGYLKGPPTIELPTGSPELKPAN